jgi:hypothetical protein
MPPVTGMRDETSRQKLIGVAQEFAGAGDQALAYEGESTPASSP